MSIKISCTYYETNNNGISIFLKTEIRLYMKIERNKMQLNGFRFDIGDIRPLFFFYYFLAQFEIKLFDVSWFRLLLKRERSKFCSRVLVQACTCTCTCTSSFLSYLLIYWMWRKCVIPMNNNLTGVVYLWGRDWEKRYTHPWTSSYTQI